MVKNLSKQRCLKHITPQDHLDLLENSNWYNPALIPSRERQPLAAMRSVFGTVLDIKTSPTISIFIPRLKTKLFYDAFY